jgi:two-component system osmolarity sensor histidine kinase EnvZ
LPSTQFYDFDASVAESQPDPRDAAKRPGVLPLSLFWRTFLLLTLLLLGSLLAWLQTINSLEYEDHAMEVARELASQANLSRAALIHADPIARIALLKMMSEEEGLQIYPRKLSDQWMPLGQDAVGRKVTREVRQRLGADTVVASSVNGRPGLWLGFVIEGDAFWLLTVNEKLHVAGGATWLVWMGVAVVLSLSGAALIARLINRPLKQLSIAASRVREGRFDASRLDEDVPTHELRDVNIGFNRMAQRLAKIEEDRVVMLAGISHDLRTPLARLRLETEMSVADPQARADMAADIEQLDAIIDKFLDYARPDFIQTIPVPLQEVIDTCIHAIKKRPDVRIKTFLEPRLAVHADAVELGRVVSNLLENACRYGKTVDTGIADIDIAAIARGNWVLLKIRDHGIGVAQEQLTNLVQPFYRGEAARTAANGTGLGLAIVDKAVRRMGGGFAITNASSGGLSANIRLQRATRS